MYIVHENPTKKATEKFSVAFFVALVFFLEFLPPTIDIEPITRGYDYIK